MCPPLVHSGATSNTSLTVYGTYVDIKCNTGYKLADSNTSKVVFCDDGPAWSDPEPTECFGKSAVVIMCQSCGGFLCQYNSLIKGNCASLKVF